MSKTEILNKYKDVQMVFSSYFKYSFSFTGVTKEGYKVYAEIGGNSEDIYRIEVGAGDVKTLLDLDPYYVNITNSDKVTIAMYYDN